MKKSEFKQLIKESIRDVLKEDVSEDLKQFGITPGQTEIWYAKRIGIDPFSINIYNLSKSHVLLGTTDELNPEEIYIMMQGENWSSKGEARNFIISRGLGHTSMTIGDIVKLPSGETKIVDVFGFKDLNKEE